MPEFRPFKGIRINKNIVSQFVSKSIDAYQPDELERCLKDYPLSYLQIIKPTWEQTDLSPKQRYKKVRNNFDEYYNQGVLKQDVASFYIYQQKTEEFTVKGILGMVSINDFKNKIIKKHEETLEQRKQLFANYIKEVELYAEPVLLTHKNNQRLEIIVGLETNKKPVYNFKDDAGTTHTLWQVTDRLNLKQIKDSVEGLDALYIADGHHRMGSSEIYTDHKRVTQKTYSSTDYFNYTLTMLVPEKELIIQDYNRLIKDLNGHSKADFLALLEDKFIITPKGSNPYTPSKKHHISMYLDGEFYALYIKHQHRGKPEGLGELDAFLFEQNILQPILNIHNTRQDNRIDFIAGTKDVQGIKKIKQKVDSGQYKVGFGFYPVAASDLQLISDLHLKMPPKSTFINPKLLSGLVFLDLKS